MKSVEICIDLNHCCSVWFRYFGIPMEILPRVRSSSEIYGLMVSILINYAYTLCSQV